MGEKSAFPLIVMILINVPILIGGGAIFAAGILLKTGSGFMDPDVLELFNRIKVDSVSMGTMSDAATYVMMIVGVIIMLIALLGLCGAYLSNNSCLCGYVVILIILLVMQITVVGLWIFMRRTVDAWFKGQMLELLEEYEGPEATDAVSKGWNTLFIYGECCGVNNQYEDGSNNDFMEVPANWWANRAGDYVPATCCEGVTEDTITKYIGKNKCPATPKKYYETGCYHMIVEELKMFSLVIFIAVGIIFFIEILGFVQACTLMKNNKVDSS